MNKKKGYIATKYSVNSHPYTSYPDQLCKHLFDTFNMKENMILLEPGCGRCEFLEGFKKLKINVYGTDLSEESIDFAKDIEIQLCDMDKEKLPFNDHTFDIVFSKSFIEHLYEPNKYISESMRVLKKGGLLITLTPDWESNYKKFYDDFTHRSPFTTISLKDIYEFNGFKDVNTFKFRQLPIVWKYPLLNYFCSFISVLIPVRVKNKFLRWSRELMLIGVGRK